MKIVIVGATGTIGKSVAAALEKDHEVIRASFKRSDYQLDVNSVTSIESFFQRIGKFDALVSTIGKGHFGPLSKMTENEFRIGIDAKLMTQVNLVLMGQHYIQPKGSITLTSGILSEIPVWSGVNLSAVNGAIEGFVMASATELENDVRINVVSPGVVEESPQLFPAFPGHIPVPMNHVVKAYLRSILGPETGKVIKAYS